MRALLVLVVLLCNHQLQAATRGFALQPRKLGSYVRDGVIIGGSSGVGFSILRVEKLESGDTSEKLVITYGDQTGKALKTDPGYFHVRVDERSKRVTIDLAQVQRTAFDAKDLEKAIRGSRLISSSEMTMDPVDLSTNISIQTRDPVEVKADILSSRGVRQLVIELKPAGGVTVTGSRGG